MFEIKAICDGKEINNPKDKIIVSYLPTQEFLNGFISALKLQYVQVKVIIESVIEVH